MTIASEITRIKTAIADAYTACQEMGATMPAVLSSDNLEQCIASISGGGSSATVLHLYDRVDGKATVAGFWTDGNGQRYAVCVADAQYRYSGRKWSNSNVDTTLPNYLSGAAALAATESATFNMNTIRSYYDVSTAQAFYTASPVFYTAYAKTIIIDGVTYNGSLPNAAELRMIWNDRTTLDTYDTTLTDYPNNSLYMWNMGGSSAYCWTSNEASSSQAYYINKDGSVGVDTKSYGYCVIPVFEIPVDENGEVQ